ncbi:MULTISPECIES: DUF4113 domain-containing protein [Nitrosomonas]
MQTQYCLGVLFCRSKKSWSIGREIISPCYTTNWQDVPIAYAHLPD